jgi:hypothetical protein
MFGFKVPTKKPSRWFWGLNHQTEASDFEAKPGGTVATNFEAKLKKTVATGFEAKLAKNIATGFEAKPLETVAIGFETKPMKTVTTAFEAKPAKTVRVILRSNHSQPVDLGFKAQPRNLRSSSPRARCRVHMAPPDLCDHPRSSTPGLLLLPRSSSLHAMQHLPPAHHETSKHDSPNETKIKEKQNKIVPDSNSTLASQWLIIIKQRNWPLGFSEIPLNFAHLDDLTASHSFYCIQILNWSLTICQITSQVKLFHGQLFLWDSKTFLELRHMKYIMQVY